MTNSRLTDPEVLEWRFPVLVEEFSPSGRGSAAPGNIAAATAWCAGSLPRADDGGDPLRPSRRAALRPGRRRAGRRSAQLRRARRRRGARTSARRTVSQMAAGRRVRHRDAGRRRLSARPRLKTVRRSPCAGTIRRKFAKPHQILLGGDGRRRTRRDLGDTEPIVARARDVALHRRILPRSSRPTGLLGASFKLYSMSWRASRQGVERAISRGAIGVHFGLSRREIAGVIEIVDRAPNIPSPRPELRRGRSTGRDRLGSIARRRRNRPWPPPARRPPARPACLVVDVGSVDGAHDSPYRAPASRRAGPLRHIPHIEQRHGGAMIGVEAAAGIRPLLGVRQGRLRVGLRLGDALIVFTGGSLAPRRAERRHRPAQ